MCVGVHRSVADTHSYKQHFSCLDFPTRYRRHNHSQLGTLQDFCFMQSWCFMMHEDLYNLGLALCSTVSSENTLVFTIPFQYVYSLSLRDCPTAHAVLYLPLLQRANTFNRNTSCFLSPS